MTHLGASLISSSSKVQCNTPDASKSPCMIKLQRDAAPHQPCTKNNTSPYAHHQVTFLFFSNPKRSVLPDCAKSNINWSLTRFSFFHRALGVNLSYYYYICIYYDFVPSSALK